MRPESDPAPNQGSMMPTDPTTIDLAQYVAACIVPDPDVYVQAAPGVPGKWIVGWMSDDIEHDELLATDGTWTLRKDPCPAENLFPDAKTALAAALNHPKDGSRPKKVRPDQVDPTSAEHLHQLQVGEALITSFRSSGPWGVAFMDGRGIIHKLHVSGEWNTAKECRYRARHTPEVFEFPTPQAAIAAALDHPFKQA